MTSPCSFCGKPVTPHPKADDSGYVLAFCGPQCLASWQVDKSEEEISALSPNVLRCPWCKCKLESGYHDASCPARPFLEALYEKRLAPRCGTCAHHVVDAIFDPATLPRQWGQCQVVLCEHVPLPPYEKPERPAVKDDRPTPPYILNECCESGARLMTPVTYWCPLHERRAPER